MREFRKTWKGIAIHSGPGAEISVYVSPAGYCGCGGCLGCCCGCCFKPLLCG